MVQVRIYSSADTDMWAKFTQAKHALVLVDQSHFSTVTEIVSIYSGNIDSFTIYISIFVRAGPQMD